MKYFVYLLRCSDGSFYCGYTVDLEKRLREHNSSKTGAKYTRRRRPVTLIYNEVLSTLSDALKREYAIKKLTHEEKSKLK